MDEDTEQGAWGEQDLQERRRQEDEAVERHRKMLEEFRRDNAIFDRETNDFHERVRP